MNKKLTIVWVAMLQLLLCFVTQAQVRALPPSVKQWMKSPGLEHATVTLEVMKLPQRQVIYSHDPERFVTPASVMKLVTAATGFRLLGADYVWPDSVPLVDTTAVALPGLEHYNPDWLIEDIDTDYMPPMENLLPDSGRVLQDVMRQTLLESLNLEAETMMRLLTPSCRLDSGLLTIERYWRQQGLDVSGLRMFDGNGLSPNDRVTAHFITTLLANMQNDEPFRQSMAKVGYEGTVSNFLKDTRLAGKAWLKTGTLKNVVAYAGYAKGSDSKLYAVAIFVNNHSCKHREVRKGIEKVLLSLIP